MPPIDHTIDYRLRDIDKRLWTRVKDRARSEGAGFMEFDPLSINLFSIARDDFRETQRESPFQLGVDFGRLARRTTPIRTTRPDGHGV